MMHNLYICTLRFFHNIKNFLNILLVFFLVTTYGNIAMLPAYWRIGREAPWHRLITARVSTIILAIADLREDIGRFVVIVRNLSAPRLTVQSKFSFVDLSHVESTLSSDTII